MTENVLNEQVKNAIYSAVREYRQPVEVAKRIEAWMSQVANGNVSLDKPDDYKTYLETTLSALQIVEDE